MQESKRKIINDIILIAAVILIAAIALIIYLATAKDGQTVVVTVNGEHYASYPLSEDTTVLISADNASSNLLVIENGKASITEASCPDLICAHHAPISREDEAIICLPNKTVVSIE